jgi:WD40 repeat protein
MAHFRDDHTLRVFDHRGADSVWCREWDLRSGTEVHSWQIPIPPLLHSTGDTPDLLGVRARSFLAATFSADGERCLIGNTARKSVVYNLRSGASEFVDIGLAARFPQFSPDGNLLTGREGSEIKLWESATFREVATLPTFMRMPQSIAFSPNGVRLAVGSANREAVILWNPRTHEPVLTLEGNGAQFIRTAFSSHGNRLGSRSTFLPGDDGILHVWSAPSWEEIEAAETLAASSRTSP